MNIDKGKLFAALRDPIEKLYGSKVAIQIARLQLPYVESFLKTKLERKEESFSSASQLNGEVVRRAEWLIRPIREQVARLPILRWLEEKLYSVQYSTWLMCTAMIEKAGQDLSTLRALLLLAGVEGLTDSPPILLPGKPLRLFFWSIARNLMNWGMLAFREFWEYAQAQAHDEILRRVGKGVLSAQDRFALAYQDVASDLPYAEQLAHLQWQAAGIVGSLVGVDGVDLAWHPHALRRMEEGRQRVIRFLENPSPESMEGLMRFFAEVQPTTGLRIAEEVSQHLLSGEPLRMPAVGLSTTRIGVGDAVHIGGRIVINHPLVSNREIMRALSQWRRDFRSEWHKALQKEPRLDSKEDFLALVREMGGEPGQRLPKGFWEKFRAEWQKRYPDRPMTVEHLRVYYHRLVRRAKASGAL